MRLNHLTFAVIIYVLQYTDTRTHTYWRHIPPHFHYTGIYLSATPVEYTMKIIWITITFLSPSLSKASNQHWTRFITIIYQCLKMHLYWLTLNTVLQFTFSGYLSCIGNIVNTTINFKIIITCLQVSLSQRIQLH